MSPNQTQSKRMFGFGDEGGRALGQSVFVFSLGIPRDDIVLEGNIPSDLRAPTSPLNKWNGLVDGRLSGEVLGQRQHNPAHQRVQSA